MSDPANHPAEPTMFSESSGDPPPTEASRCVAGVETSHPAHPASTSAAAPQAGSTPRPPFSFVTVFFSAAMGAWWLGGVGSANGSFSTGMLTPSGMIGGCLGLLLGLAVILDNRFVLKRIEKTEAHLAPDPTAFAQPASASETQSNAVAAIMLVLPLVAGILIWQREWMQMTTPVVRSLCFAVVLSTALLGYYDMRRLLLRSRSRVSSGSQTASPTPVQPVPLNQEPAFSFGAILGLWFIAYPVHFVARRRLGASNLIAPAFVVTAVFLAPTVGAWFSDPALPSAQSPDVLAVVSKIIEDNPMYQARKDEIGKLQVREPVEISFDPQRQRRVARAKLVSNLGEEEIFYTIEWQDRKKHLFSVQVFDQQP